MDIYDLVIKNGVLINVEKESTSNEKIGIIKNKIVAVTSEEIQGKVTIDAKGCIISPGFIDVHAHLEGHLESGKLSALQGVTTSIGGNCGISPIHTKKFLDAQDEKGFIINQAELVGQSISLREAVGISSPYLPASGHQILDMAVLIEKSFQEGAIGLSFGFEYAPGSSFEEMKTLFSISEKYKKIIPIHTNIKGPRDLDSLAEIIDLAESTGAHILIAHFVYQYGNGLMTEALELVDKARDKGIKVSVDSGMYTDFATFIGSTIYDLENINKMGWKFENMLVSTGKYKGRTLTTEIYNELRRTKPKETVICFTGIEDQIYEALEKNYVMPSSDTGSKPKAHPQGAGTFPRFFRKMVRERKSLTIIEAVKRCTLLPAETFGLENKGRICEGSDADIVIFDIDKITDKSAFLGRGEPDAKPEGINYVIVNGQIIVEEGSIVNNVLPGKTIRA